MRQRPRATFSTSGSSYLNVALTAVHRLPCIICIMLFVLGDNVTITEIVTTPSEYFVVFS